MWLIYFYDRTGDLPNMWKVVNLPDNMLQVSQNLLAATARIQA